MLTRSDAANAKPPKCANSNTPDDESRRTRRKRLKHEHKSVEQSLASFAHSFETQQCVDLHTKPKRSPADNRAKRRKKHGGMRHGATKLEPIGNRGGYIVANESMHEHVQWMSGEEAVAQTEDEFLKLPDIGGRQHGGLRGNRRGTQTEKGHAKEKQKQSLWENLPSI
ncbi:uncharacterized protein LOC134176210 isoform X2 [Corticium candelabrum]|uniref:uncharacterized protein LOC134176210 isoform X2 n=1 Tax=Corticium candelabrum TaxID=121492 RepID=UPI002E26383E|nr:uncharacterized protein LOC134176210 isoform X2 [Corticium candelabrum]